MEHNYKSLLFTLFTVTIKQVQGYCFFNSR